MPTQPPSGVRFPMDFRHRIYLCMECHNHVLNVPTHNSNLVILVPYVSEQSAVMAGGVICDAGGMAVNVRVGSPRNCWFRNRLPVVNVYCTQSHSDIGERLIWYCRVRCTPSGETHTYGGPILLYLCRGSMQYWDGRSTVFAEDYRPVIRDDE
ncbi:hypothetical protein V6N13_055703 [Hibiscus sabdariffa]